MANYPTGYDSYTTPGSTMDLAVLHGTRHVNTDSAVVAIESTLGLSPQGADASVRARLDKIDTRFTLWTAYTPTLGGIGWSLGTTGSDAAGAYCVINDVVHFWSRVIFGTAGATFGASPNVPTVSLPLTADAGQINFHPRGSLRAQYSDVSAPVDYEGLASLSSTVASLLITNVGAGTYPAHENVLLTIPFVWAAGDRIHLSGWYRKAL